MTFAEVVACNPNWVTELALLNSSQRAQLAEFCSEHGYNIQELNAKFFKVAGFTQAW